jgi:hypothetical protein
MRDRTPGSRRKHQKMLSPTARTADSGESAPGMAAVKILLDEVLYDRTNITIELTFSAGSSL